ncbi:hypothetical protein CK503_11935 [Aliifodinibius salipaludis]|uniref:Uncharacterized protein n=1 Tax=Fodinibius salipaludis TaxID=2032627 RepID=A0A2A2G9B0_9BACT|nr:hypothetical protein CK503_11935 [Aliifodinibius salipaludis]
MVNRILRLLVTGLNAYSFYSNPYRFIIGILCIIILPCLAYIFWGTVIIIALLALGIYFIYKAFKQSYYNSTYYS